MNTLDYHNENSLRNYPLKDHCTRQSTDQQFTLPNDFIVDMTVAVAGTAGIRCYISKLVNAASNVAVTISDASDVVVGVFNLDLSQHTSGDDYGLTAGAAYSSANGRMTIWGTEGMTAAPLGTFLFTLAATELCMRVVVPCIAGVSRIAFVDAAGTSVTLTGHITLQAESNLRFRQTGNRIYLDAAEGLGLNTSCPSTPYAIQTINGVRGDVNGDFVLIPSDCADFISVPNGLMLRDTCAKPCTGCSDLSELTNRTALVESEMLATKKFIDELSTKLTQLTTLATYTYDCQTCA